MNVDFLFIRRDYERVLHIDPLCLPARVNLAYCLQVTGKFMQAWHQFTAAIAIDSSKLFWKQNHFHNSYSHDHPHHTDVVITSIKS